MPYCLNCGREVGETENFCSNCGAQIIGKAEKVPAEAPKVGVQTGAMEALSKGVTIITAKPMVLMPALLGAVISAVLSFGGEFDILLTLIGAIISYVLSFAALDMSRNAYLNQELNLSKSIHYVIKRIGTFIVASIVGALLAITIILAPVAVLMFVIIVVDETGIGNAASRALKVLGARLVEIIILIVIAIIADIILGLIPFVGSILVVAFNVLIALAFIDIYYGYKRTEISVQ
ncbi:zinc ribbon domain-containing protein [Candidatus Bathyarchaeota archaeon]|nr:zinc ribbon domain-containing protein [Candidatus Bathyarchaeota archaeon]